jgi:hypothetical protein
MYNFEKVMNPHAGNINFAIFKKIDMEISDNIYLKVQEAIDYNIRLRIVRIDMMIGRYGKLYV